MGLHSNTHSVEILFLPVSLHTSKPASSPMEEKEGGQEAMCSQTHQRRKAVKNICFTAGRKRKSSSLLPPLFCVTCKHHLDTNPLVTQLLHGYPCLITTAQGSGFPGTAYVPQRGVHIEGNELYAGFPSEMGAVGTLTCPRLSKLYLW